VIARSDPRPDQGADSVPVDLIRGVMAEAAEAHGERPGRLSFKGALQTMTAFQDALRWAAPGARGRLIGAILEAIAPPRR
jgi:hypothetical protein